MSIEINLFAAAASVACRRWNEIETANPSLKGALPKIFGKESLKKTMLSGLIELFTNDIKLGGTPAGFDLIGRIATLRDTLLPKLMSDEVRVGEAREQVEAAA